MTSQLTVDYTKCTGCRICELACSAKHEGRFQPSLARLKIVRYDDLGIDIPNVCGPCEDAPCVEQEAAKLLAICLDLQLDLNTRESVRNLIRINGLASKYPYPGFIELVIDRFLEIK